MSVPISGEELLKEAKKLSEGSKISSAMDAALSGGLFIQTVYQGKQFLEFTSSANRLIEQLQNEQRALSAAKEALDLCSNNKDDSLWFTIFGQCSRQDLMDKVNQTNLEVNEIRQIATNVGDFLKSTQVKMANKAIESYVVSSAITIIGQVYLTVDIFLEIKSASNVIKDPILFSSIEQKIVEMKTKIDEIKDAINNKDSKLVKEDLLPELETLNVETISEISDIKGQLGNVEIALNFAEKKSISGALTNGINTATSLVNLAQYSTYLTPTNLFLAAITSLGFGALTFANVGAYCLTQKRLDELRAKKKELNDRQHEVKMLGENIKQIRKNLREYNVS